MISTQRQNTKWFFIVCFWYLSFYKINKQVINRLTIMAKQTATSSGRTCGCQTSTNKLTGIYSSLRISTVYNHSPPIENPIYTQHIDLNKASFMQYSKSKYTIPFPSIPIQISNLTI
jgi:hypothetical protein